MIKKFFIYLKSDGLWNALAFTLKSITSLVYNKSVTNIYKRITGEEEYNNEAVIKEVGANEVERMDFPRLKLLDWRKWLENKSRLYVAYIGNKPVGYAWIHYHSYHFAGKYNFGIEENEVWIGPSFVKKEFRGKGLQKALTQYRLSKIKNCTVYTSVSSNNIASNKCMKRNNFEFMGTVTITTLFGKEIKTAITPQIKDKIQRQ